MIHIILPGGAFWILDECRLRLCFRIPLLRLDLARILLGILLATAFAYYLSNVGGALNVDEAWHAEIGYAFVAQGNIFYQPNVVDHPPLWRYFVGLSQLVLGRSSLGVRFPSAVLAVLTGAVTYVLCSRIWSRSIGLFSSAALLFSPFFGTFAVEGTPDMASVFFEGVLLMLVATCLIGGTTLSRAVLIGLFSGLALGDRYNMAAIILPIFLAMYMFRKGRPSLKHSLVIALALLGALLIVFGPYLLTPVKSVQYFLGPIITDLGGTTGSMFVFTSQPRWIFADYLRQYVPFSFCALILGHLLLFVKRTPAKTLLILTADAYLLSISFLPVRFPRYLLPLLAPSTALIFGLTADIVAAVMPKLWRTGA